MSECGLGAVVPLSYHNWASFPSWFPILSPTSPTLGQAELCWGRRVRGWKPTAPISVDHCCRCLLLHSPSKSAKIGNMLFLTKPPTPVSWMPQLKCTWANMEWLGSEVPIQLVWKDYNGQVLERKSFWPWHRAASVTLPYSPSACHENKKAIRYEAKQLVLLCIS